MSTETAPLNPEIPALPAAPAENSAIARCRQAWIQTLSSPRPKGEEKYSAQSRAAEAFRDAMPPLLGYENIRDFIACAAYGMSIGAISPIALKEYLYAAQVAVSALRCQPKPTAEPRPVGRPLKEK